MKWLSGYVDGATGQAGGKPSIEFADAKVGRTIHYKNMNYTADGGQHWITRDIQFLASVEEFSLVRPDNGYVVGAHGMVYRFRAVPIEYTSKGMLAAPTMLVKRKRRKSNCGNSLRIN